MPSTTNNIKPLKKTKSISFAGNVASFIGTAINETTHKYVKGKVSPNNCIDGLTVIGFYSENSAISFLKYNIPTGAIEMIARTTTKH
jgi:hypothetical protein